MEAPLPQPNEPIDLVVELVTLHRDDNGEYEDEHVVEYRNSRWFHGISISSYSYSKLL